MTFTGIPLNLLITIDPMHYILNLFKLLNSTIVAKKIVGVLARIIYIYCTLDCVRTYTIFLTIIFGSVSNTYSIPTILAANFGRLPCRYIILFCRLTLLVYKLVQEAFETFGGTALSLLFWAVSILIAIIVKKSSDITPVIFGLLLSTAAATCFAIFVCLHVISSIVKKSEKIVCHIEKMSRLVFVETRNVNYKLASKAIWYEASAITPLRVRFKPFCNIDRNFVMDYVQNVRSRVFDMI